MSDDVITLDALEALASSEYRDQTDPGKVYRDHVEKVHADNPLGFVNAAYHIFGPAFISNLALKLDAYKWIRSMTTAITPYTRTTIAPSIRLKARGYHSHRDNETCATNANTGTPDLVDHYGYQRCVTSQTQVSDLTLTSQAKYEKWIKDSVRSDRGLGSPGGEMELFHPELFVPSYSLKYDQHTWTRTYVSHQGHIDPQSSDSHKYHVRRHTGPWGYVSPAGIDQCLAQEQSDADSYMNQYYKGMLADLLPSNPVFDLAYNIGELKDLPMMLRNSTLLFTDRHRLLELRGQGSQYLNVEFGWLQLYDAIKDLLTTPEKVAKRVNWLLSRQGKWTNLRSTKKLTTDFSAVPTFVYNLLPGETSVSTGKIASRDIELRMAINARIVLPDLVIPELREDLILKAWGAKPTPKDIYNLVPWSWLVDWFTAVGEYVRLMDLLYQDDSLFNYGYYSYVSKGRCNYSVGTKVTDTKSWIVDGDSGSSSKTRKLKHNATYRWKYHKRIDISTLPDLKATSRPTSLSGDQLAIIGALLTKFT